MQESRSLESYFLYLWIYLKYLFYKNQLKASQVPRQIPV